MRHRNKEVEIVHGNFLSSIKPKKLRNQNIEVVRIAAAFGIVVFHSGATGAELGYSGLVAFTMLGTYFAGGSAQKLALRMMVPWAFWSFFYLGWRFAADGSPFHEGLSPLASVMYGTHLWFLPFIFIANLTVATVGWRHFPTACAISAFALMAATPWWKEIQMATEPPVAQYLYALPAALIGVALRDKIGIAVSASGLIVCLVWAVPGVSLPYSVGGGVVIAALLAPRLRWNVEWASECMLGVYLVHIAALGVFNRLLVPGDLITAAAAFVAAFLGVWLVRKYAPPTKLVLG